MITNPKTFFEQFQNFIEESGLQLKKFKSSLSNYFTKSEAIDTFLGKTDQAESAKKSDEAIKATQDSEGNVISSTYLTQANASSTYLTKTGKATSASTADTATKATKATQDASGNIITSTYATKAEVTQGLAGKEDKGTCLPLTGGVVLGDILSDPVQRGELFLGHSFTDKSGAFLAVRSAIRDDGEHGTFLLGARTPEKECYLEGYPDGDLVWGGAIVDGIVGQGDGWVRYNSGIQICWGWREFRVNLVPWGALYEANVPNFITFPMPFKYTPIVTTTSNNNFTPQQGVDVSPTGIGSVWFWFTEGLQDRITSTGYIAIGAWR